MKLFDLGVELPVLSAPMSGGPTTPELVVAADRAGSLGFLAGGYKTAEALAIQLAAVRAETSSYGVNLFAPRPVPVDPAAYRRYRELLLPEAERLGVVLPAEPVEDDDYWRDKVDLLVSVAPPVMSFTFGIPGSDVLRALRAAGSLLVQTVTSAEEAELAHAAGVDALTVQSTAAGGHSGTLRPEAPPVGTPLPELVAEIGDQVPLPLLATGGIGTPAEVAAALAAGAVAVLVGTALLLAPESGTSSAHRAALAGHDRDTVVTRSFSGRPARGLRNRFIDRYDADAPAGYPALHHLTIPMRQASAAAGDAEGVNLWAGTGYRAATQRPAAEILRDLAVGL
jgi:nitronate monooxygenase